MRPPGGPTSIARVHFKHAQWMVPVGVHGGRQRLGRGPCVQLSVLQRILRHLQRAGVCAGSRQRAAAELVRCAGGRADSRGRARAEERTEASARRRPPAASTAVAHHGAATARSLSVRAPQAAA